MNMREFDYLGKTLQVDLNKNKKLYQAFKEEEHNTYYFEGHKPKNIDELYYRKLLFDTRDEEELKMFLNNLLSLEADYIDELELLVAYIQSAISYDWHAYNSKEGGTKYPLETYYLGKGICGDKSILLGKLLSLLKYDFVLFIFEKANHMAVGIKVPHGYGNYGTDYAFIETTGITPIGFVPNNFINNIVLEDDPKILYFSGGRYFKEYPRIRARYQEIEKKYGNNILHLNAFQFTSKIKMLNMQNKVDSLETIYKPYEGKSLNSSDYEKAKKLQIKLRETINEYNKLVSEFNSNN
jgi:hypothetical protein